MWPFRQVALTKASEQNQILDVDSVQAVSSEIFLELEHLCPILLCNALPDAFAASNVTNRSDLVVEADTGGVVRLDFDDQREVLHARRLWYEGITVARIELKFYVE